MSAPPPPPSPASDCEIVAARHFPFPPARVFAAFTDAARVAQWWGPAGFTNTVDSFDFRLGGAWHIAMTAPDGTVYPNEWRFLEIDAPARLVLDHERPGHRFLLTVTFSAQPGGTRLGWRMRFDSAEEVARIRAFVVPANEQNFDRLHAHLLASA